MGLMYTITDLTSIHWDGDDKIENFRNAWQAAVAGMPSRLNDEILMEIILTQMLESKELKDEVTRFRKLATTDPLRTYNRLIDILDEHLSYDRQQRNRQHKPDCSHDNNPPWPWPHQPQKHNKSA